MQSAPECSAAAGPPKFARHWGYESFANDMDASSVTACLLVQVLQTSRNSSNVVFPRVQTSTNSSGYA